MDKSEQLDALQIDIINICNTAQNTLTDTSSDQILTSSLTNLQVTVNRYLSEFDTNMYEIAGILEATKLDLLMSEEASTPDVIGLIESVKMSILTGDSVEFECDIDLDDLDDY